jgi:hypothetical protein
MFQIIKNLSANNFIKKIFYILKIKLIEICKNLVLKRKLIFAINFGEIHICMHCTI